MLLAGKEGFFEMIGGQREIHVDGLMKALMPGAARKGCANAELGIYNTRP